MAILLLCVGLIDILVSVGYNRVEHTKENRIETDRFNRNKTDRTAAYRQLSRYD